MRPIWRICSSARTAASARPRRIGSRASATSRAAARNAASASCSSCSTTTTRRRTPPSSSATSRAASSAAAAARKELTGLSDEKVIGREVREVLGLDFEGGADHVGTVLEWGVRQLGKPVVVQRGGRSARARRSRICSRRTMTTAACCSCSRRPSSANYPSPPVNVRTPPLSLRPADRPRADRGLRLRGHQPGDQARPRPAGRRPARSTRASRPRSSRRSRRRRCDARSTSCASASTRSASPSPSCCSPATTRSRSTSRASRTPSDAEHQVGSTAQLFFYDWEANILDENCKADPAENASAKQPITGFYNAIERASECEAQADGNNNAADALALLRVRQDRPTGRSTTACRRRAARPSSRT